MGNILVETAYNNLNRLVNHIHQKVYKGQRDRNRYQLNHSIYVWWEGGRITKIFDCTLHQKLEITPKGVFSEDNVNGFGNVGFYVDVQNLVDEAIKATAASKTVEVYSSLNNLQQALIADVKTVLTLS